MQWSATTEFLDQFEHELGELATFLGHYFSYFMVIPQFSISNFLPALVRSR